MDHITKLLRKHKRPKQSETAVYNQVLLACSSAEVATRSTKPIDVDQVTKELVSAARELLRVLGHSALPPNYMFRVFDTMQIGTSLLNIWSSWRRSRTASLHEILTG